MDGEALMVYASALAVSVAGLSAVVFNRFHRVLAGVVVLAASACPWLFILALNGRLRGDLLALLGMYGSPPLFCIAFFLYGAGKKTARRGIAATAALIGMFLAIGYTLLLVHLLSHME